MFWLYQNCSVHSCFTFEHISHAAAFVLTRKISEMEQLQNIIKIQGGRPEKPVKRDELAGVKCTKSEAFIIRARAEKLLLTVSEYLREIALTGKIDMRKKVLSKVVLFLTATLNRPPEPKSDSKKLEQFPRIKCT